MGHLALGYLTGKTTSKLVKVNLNLPLLLAASIIPDVDLLIPGLEHRGPTHSLIVYGILLIPAFLLWRRKVIPYFVALTQHSLIGDGVTGGAQLLWPLTNANLRIAGIQVTSPINITLEWILFLASFSILLKTKEMYTLLKPHPSNLLLLTPVITVLLPTILSFPQTVPFELIIPHFIYIAIFTLSIILDFRVLVKN